jgi:hypothetical protein
VDSWWFVEDSNPVEIVFGRQPNGNVEDGIEGGEDQEDKDLYSNVVKRKWW